MPQINTIKNRIDWFLLFLILPIMLAGLFTMKSFTQIDGANVFFDKQIIWITISLTIFFIFSFIDFSFLKDTKVLMFLFISSCGILVILLFLGNTVFGSKSWFNFGFFSFQPVDFTKLILILLLAKYFSRRHVEIYNIKHIFISGFYAFIPFILILLQPDFGSAMIIFFIWLGMVLVSGISKKHLLFVFLSSVIIFIYAWFFIFSTYQKNRINNFIHPMTNIRTSGYNAFQSTIAVGSGQIFGKGLGFGTQSRLKFLPQPQADFIFASYAEEWGFIGSIFILFLYLLIILRILYLASLGFSNFEVLFGLGVAIFFMSHIFVNIGMNLAILPVTGIPLTFMSYGGSHLVVEFMALGILMSMRKYSRSAHRDDIKNEFLGI